MTKTDKSFKKAMKLERKVSKHWFNTHFPKRPPNDPYLAWMIGNIAAGKKRVSQK